MGDIQSRDACFQSICTNSIHSLDLEVRWSLELASEERSIRELSSCIFSLTS
jgi:hypothetical protein